MLDPGIRFTDFEPEDWPRVLALGGLLFGSPGTPGEVAAPNPAAPGLFLLHDGGRLRKVLCTQRGRREPRSIPWPCDLGELAKLEGAGWVVAVRLGVLEEWMEHLGALARPDHDILDQLLQFQGLVRSSMLQGALTTWPWPSDALPAPWMRGQIERILHHAWPRGTVWMVAVQRGHALWTALIVRRTPKGPFRIDTVAGPAQVRRRIGRLAPRSVLSVVDHLYGPVSLALHVDVEVLSALLARPAPWAWVGAVTRGQVVFSRWPAALGVVLARDWLLRVVSQVRTLGPAAGRWWTSLRRTRGRPSSGPGSSREPGGGPGSTK